MMKTKLSGAAVAGALLMLLWAALIPMIRPGIYRPSLISYIDLAAVVILAIPLFCRARAALVGVGFLLLCADPAYSLYLSDFIHVNDPLQAIRYILPMVLGLAAAIGMAIVCFRRLSGPKAGPWILPPLCQLAVVLVSIPTLPALIRTGLQDVILSRIFFLGRNLICFVGMLLTAVSFQKGYAAARADRSAPAAGYGGYSQPGQSGPAPSYAPPRNEAPPAPPAPAEHYEEADYDILDD